MMHYQLNPFENASGSNKLKSPNYVILILGIAVVAGLLISKSGLMAGTPSVYSCLSHSVFPLPNHRALYSH
jgi:hypothetical protein